MGRPKAADYKIVDKVAPFFGALVGCCRGLHEDAVITSVFVNHVEMKDLIKRRRMFPGWSEPELQCLQKSITSFKDGARSVFRKYQPSKMGTSKWLALDLLVHLREVGGVQYFHGGIFEQTHKELKKNYQRTSIRLDSLMTEISSQREEREVFEKMSRANPRR